MLWSSARGQENISILFKLVKRMRLFQTCQNPKCTCSLQACECIYEPSSKEPLCHIHHSPALQQWLSMTAWWATASFLGAKVWAVSKMTHIHPWKRVGVWWRVPSPPPPPGCTYVWQWCEWSLYVHTGESPDDCEHETNWKSALKWHTCVLGVCCICVDLDKVCVCVCLLLGE